jgi:hypothetical protein
LKIAAQSPLAAVISLLTATVFTIAALSQTPQGPPQAGQPAPDAAQGPPPQSAGQGTGQGERPMRNFPPPTNLQVLPKDLTGREVHDIMETWEGSLGVHCDFCHTADPKNLGPNGRPRLNFADDSKPNKQIARIMYSMTQQANKDYIAKAMDLDTDHAKDNMGSPVTCGTCHRGHEMPEAFVIPREEHRGGPGGGPGAPPPATGATPPAN